MAIEIEAIGYLACPASISAYQQRSIKTSKINFIGTLNMLELSRKLGAKFLLASSSRSLRRSRASSKRLLWVM